LRTATFHVKWKPEDRKRILLDGCRIFVAAAAALLE
jgi:hypothetical protein